MSETIPESWRPALEPVLATPEARKLGGWLKAEEAAGKQVFPPRGTRLAALALTPLDEVRCVILGQDPYHGPGQANGLCFSVSPGIKLPPSLKNIYKEIAEDLQISMGESGDLSAWAKQGVLLLNATLTVRANSPASHQGKGWEQFTDEVIRLLSSHCEGLVFILWGRPAQMKEKLIDTQKHFVLKAAHPSPLSAYNGFFGCRHFSHTNKILVSQGKPSINWIIP
jgi:uracil-DNA glycosylase